MIYTSNLFPHETAFHRFSASLLLNLDFIPVVGSIAQVARFAIKLVADLFLATITIMKTSFICLKKTTSFHKLYHSPIAQWHQKLVFLFQSLYLDELFKKSYKRCLVEMIPMASYVYALHQPTQNLVYSLKDAAIAQILQKNHKAPYCYMEPYRVPSYLKRDKDIHLAMAKLNPYTIEHFDEALFKEKDFVHNLFFEISLHFDPKRERLSDIDIQQLIKIVFAKSKEAEFLKVLKPLIESDFKSGSPKEIVSIATLFPIVAFSLASQSYFQNFRYLRKCTQAYPHVLMILPIGQLIFYKSYILEILRQFPEVFHRMPEAFKKSCKNFCAKK